MLSGLLNMGGYLILLIVYGKDRAKFYFDIFPLCAALTLSLVGWLICLLFWCANMAQEIIVPIYSIAYPIAIAAWAIYERKGN